MMVPLSDGEAAILSRLANIAQQQAVTTERLIAVLEKVDEHLSRMDVDRAEQSDSIKVHFSHQLDAKDSWWRKFAIVFGAVSAAAAAIGGSLGKFITFGSSQPR